MKKEYFLLFFSVIFTLTTSLGIIRWLAPQLLGIPSDLQLVRVSEKLPPFYEAIFRISDYQSKDYLLKDPYTKIRAKPMISQGYDLGAGMGPNDFFGFRNLSIPIEADIIILGDSQTYGNNVLIQNNWPEQMRNALLKQDKEATVYSMATGGWGAIQYLNMMHYAPVFKPQLVIVPFYTGNDPIDSYMLAYGIDKWKQFRVNPELKASDIPKSKSGDLWPVKFHDGVNTVFNPSWRNVSNMPHPAVDAGYEIMFQVAKIIAQIGKKNNIKIAFTIIPTKEWVYAKKIAQENIKQKNDYKELIKNENTRINVFSQKLQNIENSIYINLAEVLSNKALENIPLYPKDSNGHPAYYGYKIIGETIADKISNQFNYTPIDDGLFFAQAQNNKYIPGLKNGKQIRFFVNPELIEENGWPAQEAQTISSKELRHYNILPSIGTVNPLQFGPESILAH